MKDQNKVSRRQLLGMLAGISFIPAIAKDKKPAELSNIDDEFETLLKPDGTTVKVPKGAIKSAKVISNNVSNKSMLNWLKKPIK